MSAAPSVLESIFLNGIPIRFCVMNVSKIAKRGGCCADLHIFQTPRSISNLEFLKNWRKCFIELVREFFLLNYAKKDSVTLNQLCFHIFS